MESTQGEIRKGKTSRRAAPGVVSGAVSWNTRPGQSCTSCKRERTKAKAIGEKRACTTPPNRAPGTVLCRIVLVPPFPPRLCANQPVSRVLSWRRVDGVQVMICAPTGTSDQSAPIRRPLSRAGASRPTCVEIRISRRVRTTHWLISARCPTACPAVIVQTAAPRPTTARAATNRL